MLKYQRKNNNANLFFRKVLIQFLECFVLI